VEDLEDQAGAQRERRELLAVLRVDRVILIQHRQHHQYLAKAMQVEDTE
jgi:hypothetical protein